MKGTDSGSWARKFWQENLEAAGTPARLRRSHFKCSNLARGESMNDPVGYLRIPAGFFIGAM
jgi:hypothetical protein